MIPNKATQWLKWDLHISQVSHPKNVIKYSYQKSNGTWWHHYHLTVLKNTFKWYPYHIFPKKATVDHAIRCLCHGCHVKVLKKYLQNDIHIIYFQKRQLWWCHQMPLSHVLCESTHKLLQNDVHIIYFQERQWDLITLVVLCCYLMGKLQHCLKWQTGLVQ